MPYAFDYPYYYANPYYYGSPGYFTTLDWLALAALFILI